MPDVGIRNIRRLEIAPQGHFLALRAQGTTVALLPRSDVFILHYAL